MWLARLIEAIDDFIINVFHDPLAQNPSELPMNQPDAPLAPSISLNPAPQPAPQPTRAEILYDCAKSALGHAIAPASIAEVGCAVAVNLIYKRAFGKEIIPPPNDESTYWLYKFLAVSGLFEKVTTPEAGCIIISPTNMGNLPHGHTGIVGLHGIMSNDSATGLWKENYTLNSWQQYFSLMHKFPIYFFKPI